tara:strand:+ start:6260 stop:6793 length:534 start_codon:yes stop_codon:yes gene_type:complete
MSTSEEPKKKSKKTAPKKAKSKKGLSKEAKELVLAKETLNTEKDKYLRLFAEFENFKKRTSKERIELFKTAGQDVITALLPVLDDFSRAIKEADKSENSSEFEGFRLINNKLGESLKSKGLEPVSVEAGEIFDSEVHEAITQISGGDDQQGKIIDVIEKGYKLGDKILRYPKVVVGQ